MPGEDTVRWRGESGHWQVAFLPSTAGSHWWEGLHRRQAQSSDLKHGGHGGSYGHSLKGSYLGDLLGACGIARRCSSSV